MAQMTPRDVIIGSGKNEITVKLLDNEEWKDDPKAFSLVRSITWKDGSWVWVKENYPDNSRGQFYQDDTGKTYILIVTKSEIVDIYEIAKLPKYVMVGLSKSGVKYDGRGISVEDRIALKKEIAKAVGLHYKLLPSEELVQTTLRKEAYDERLQAERAEAERRQAEFMARKAENARIKALVMARPRLKGYAGTNSKWFNGIPISGDEWLKMDGGTFCVEVESYNDEDKTYGPIIGCFIVKKDGARKSKMSEDTFSFKQGGQAIITASIGEIAYRDQDEDLCTATAYPNMDAVKRLQSAGLNSGAVVAIPTTEKDHFQLVKVTAKLLTNLDVVQGVLVAD